jgi:hypothetical protein
MPDEVDRRPIEERIAVVRAQEALGELPSGDGEQKVWICGECDFPTADPQEVLRHRARHPRIDPTTG